MLIKNKIKSILAEQDSTMKDLAEKLTANGIKTSPSNLSNKLRRNSLSYAEVEIVAAILGYEIEWKKIGESR